MHDQRYENLNLWLNQLLLKQSFTVTKLAGDASFRRYFRVHLDGKSYIAMDAPPEREDCKPYMAIATTFFKLGINVPEIIAHNLDLGFILLSDFGDDLYINLLSDDCSDHLYKNALAELIKIQHCREITNWTLPYFDETLLLKEWNLFYEWVLLKHWSVSPTHADQSLLTNTFELLQREFLIQPKICVHRDYHAKNLLHLQNGNVGVLDFQDAVWGPITYDLLSLLRDCYIHWPHERVEQWVLHYYELMLENTLIKNISREQFMRWFDFASVQRHLKCLGIFTRLNHLYERPSYLEYIPRTLNYILQVSDQYPELKKLGVFLRNKAENK